MQRIVLYVLFLSMQELFFQRNNTYQKETGENFIPPCNTTEVLITIESARPTPEMVGSNHIQG